MYTTPALIVTAALLSPLAFGQKLELKLDHLKSKAAEAVETNLEGVALELAVKEWLGKVTKPDQAARAERLKSLASALKGIYVRSYEFPKPGAYSDADLEPVLQQVRGQSGWSHIVGVKEEEERTDVFLMSREAQALAVLVVVAEPDELVLLHLVGNLAPEQMKELVTSKITYDLTSFLNAQKK